MNNEEKKYIKLTPFKMQVLQSFPFIDADFDALTNYELLCKVVDYLNKTINNVDVLNDEVEEYINKFNELKAYVDNYFDNLDVQEEINNKLDEMAESGELTDIIAQYLGLAGVLSFNTVSDMKQATNLVNGSTCKTLGYYELNDGGKATYKIRNITNNDIVDEMFIISLNNENLIAELIEDNIINARQLGIYGDKTHDDTLLLQKALDSNKLLLLDGEYKITNSLIIDVGYHKGLKGKSGTKLLGDFTNGGFSILKLNNTLYDDSGSGRYGTVSSFVIDNITFSDITELNQTEITHYGNGIEFINGCTGINFINCKFRNLINGLLISNTSKGAYNDKFTGCIFSNNDYGIYINALASNDCGENFRFLNCSLSTAKLGNYISSDMYVNFIETSFDYNLGNTFIIKDNASVSLTNCHIEWYAGTPLIHIEYNASLIFNSCIFIRSTYDDGESNQYFIHGLLGVGVPEVIFNSCVFGMYRTYQSLTNAICFIKFTNCKRLETNPPFMNTPFTINLENAFNYNYPLNYNTGLTRNSTKVKVTATTQKSTNALILPIYYDNSDGKFTFKIKSSIAMDCKIDYAVGQIDGEGITNTTPALSKTVSLNADELTTVEIYYKLRRGLNLKPYFVFNLNNLTEGATFEILSYNVQVI